MVGMVGGDSEGDCMHSGLRKGMGDSRSAAYSLSPQVPVFASDISRDLCIVDIIFMAPSLQPGAFNIPVSDDDEALK